MGHFKGVCPLDKFKILLHDALLHYDFAYDDMYNVAGNCSRPVMYCSLSEIWFMAQISHYGIIRTVPLFLFSHR